MGANVDARRVGAGATVALAAAIVPAAGALRVWAPGWPPGPMWLAALAGAIACCLLAAGLVAIGRSQAQEAGRLALRARRCGRAARDLQEAARLLPPVPPPGGIGGPAEFERRCVHAAGEAESLASQAEGGRRSWRHGMGPAARRRRSALVRRTEALEAEVAALAARLAGVRDELAATATLLEGVAATLDDLCARADAPDRDGVWCDDVRERLVDARRKLEATRADLAAGRTLDALRAGRRLRLRLADLRQVLAARRASQAWLQAAPAEAERLAAAVTRLTAAGHRGLPAVPVAELTAQAEVAIAALARGDPQRAAAIQAALRARLDGIRRATIGREERREANGRRLAAARRELAILEAEFATIATSAARRRYVPDAWRRAAHLGDRLAARARAIEMVVRQAEQANHMDAQAFEEAGQLATQAEGLLAEGHGEAGRCAAAWRAPAEEEARLQARLAMLHGEVGAAYARARSLGLAPGPGIEGLLTAARGALAHEPVDLEAVRRPLIEAEAVLARFGAHLDRLAREAARPARWRPGTVVIARTEGQGTRSEADLGR